MDATKLILLLIVGVVVVHKIQGQLSVQRDGADVQNNTFIEIANTRSGPLPLRCGDSGGNVTWLILPDNGSSLLIYDGTSKGDNVYAIVGSGSQIELTIQNNVEPFRGLLKCVSTSGGVLNIQVVPRDFQSTSLNCSEEVDSRWNILWRVTYTDKRDYQPCPNDGGQTRGYALRRCLFNGTWENTVDISGCSTEQFEMLSLRADGLKSVTDAALPGSLSSFILDLSSMTVPKTNNNTHFPRDLSIINEILVSIFEVLEQRASGISSYTNIVVVFDQLLHPANTEGWQQLQMSNGSVNFLRNMERYGEYLLNYLTNNPTTPNIDIMEMYITYRVITRLSPPHETLTYPTNSDQGVQIVVPSTVLTQEQVTGAVFIIFRGIGGILPTPDLNSSVITRIATNVMSAQLYRASGLLTTFIGDAVIFNFKTQLLRSRNPRCVFLNPSPTSQTGQNWSTGGLFTVLEGTSGAEFKQFDVRCSSNHFTSFGVAVEETTTEFEITIPVYIGSAFIIISAAISVFTLMLSCMLDTFRKYFLSGYIIHMSFAASILAASVIFLAGITSALTNDVYCQTVSGLLLYFYTAAFSWLFCEVLLLVFFGPLSRNWCLFILIFLTGWGLPAISTAVTAGLLSTDLGSTTQCWIFFDGNIISKVFLGFLVPKLIFVAGSLFLLTVGCCTTYKLTYEKIQPFVKKYLVRMLWFIWISTIFLVALLSVSWVFLLLFVNAFATDLELSQWVFMGSSIVLGIWMFLFNAIVVIITQRVDYQRLWSKRESVYVEADPGKGSGYEFMSMSSGVDLSGRKSNRSSIVVGPPTTFPQDNPVFN